MHRSKVGKWWFAAIVLLFACLIVLRTVHLTADPPERLSWSGGLYGDEPAYAHNARNKAVFGKWVLDEWNPYLYNPILTLFDYLSFRTFGTGFFALRIVALFWGILSFFLVYDTLRRGFEIPAMTVLGLVLLETNYYFLMYTRLSLSDTMLTNWMILTLFLWAVGRRRSTARFFSGLSAVAVFSCKPTAIYFAAVVGMAYLFSYLREEERGGEKDFFSAARYLAPFAGGLGLGMAAWFVAYYLPFHGEIARYSKEWSKLSMPRGAGDFLDRVVGTHAPIVFKHFAWFPFTLLAGWLYLPVCAYRALKRWRTIDPLEFFALCWFVIGYFSLSGFRYRPPRYFVSLVPPMVFLAVFGLNWLLSVSLGRIRFRWNGVLATGYAGWVALTVYLADRYLHFAQSDFLMGAAVFFIGFGTWFAICRITRNGFPEGLRTFLTTGVVIAVASLVLTHNCLLFGRWAVNPGYKEVSVSRDVGRLAPRGVIAGLWAPMVCMENENRALCIAPGWFNDKDPYGKYRFTHLFLWRGNRDAELSMVRRVLGRKFLKMRLKPVKRYFIKGAWAYLFKVTEK